MNTAPHNNYYTQRELSALARLHPTYTRREIEECRENFLHYLAFVWKVYQRMRTDGRLEKLLTDPHLNPTVKPKIPPSP